MASWQVVVFDISTNERLAEHPARHPDRATVRSEWSLPEGSAVGELLITEERLAFVKALLGEPLRLRDGQEAYLSETADYGGEVVEE